MTEVMDRQNGSLPAYYTLLFNAVTDAIAALARQDYGQATAILIRGQQQAEEAYLDLEEGQEQLSPSIQAALEEPGGAMTPPGWRLWGMDRNHRAASTPVSSLNWLISASSSAAWAWTASQVCSVSYHRALRSSTLRACCSTQV